MPSHTYGAMLINGGEVHNGDKVSVVRNEIEKAFFLTDQNHIDVGELVTKLSSAVRQYETIRDHLKSFDSRHKDLVSLLNDIQDFQSALSTLQTIIEDPQSEDPSSSDDLLHPILGVSQSLDEYQSFIAEFQTNLELLKYGEASNDRGSTQLSQSYEEIRWKVNHLRDKLNSTIVVANICIQRRLQVQSIQQIHELKALLAVVETDSERRLLPSLPTRLPLKRGDLERARINDDPEFTLRRYLQSLVLQRPGVSHPPTPSIQVSSIAPSSTTGIISFVTARERQSLAGIVQNTYGSTFQIFVRGLPQFKSLVLQVDQDETIRAVKSKIEQKFDFDTTYSLSHHNRLLNDDSVVSDNLIHNLDTLNVVPYITTGQIPIDVKTLTGKTMRFYEDRPPGEFRKLTTRDLKTSIYDREGIPQAQQRLVYRGRQLEDSALLHTITDTIHLVLRLRAEPEDLDPETSLGSVDSHDQARYGTRGSNTLVNSGRDGYNSSHHGTSSSQSSKRMGRGIRMLTIQRQMRYTAQQQQ